RELPGSGPEKSGQSRPFFCGLRSKPAAVRAEGHTRVPLEETPEKRDVLIADGITDLRHAAVIALQEAFGGGDTQLLQIVQRSVPGGLLKAPHKVAKTHARSLGGRLERKPFMEILVQPRLCI